MVWGEVRWGNVNTSTCEASIQLAWAVSNASNLHKKVQKGLGRREACAMCTSKGCG